MKNHSVTINGRTFYTAQVVDAETNKTYDQTVIFEEISPDSAPQVVNYYYGDPTLENTVHYVQPLLDNATYERLLKVKKAIETIEYCRQSDFRDIDMYTEAEFCVIETMADIIEDVLTLAKRK